MNYLHCAGLAVLIGVQVTAAARADDSMIYFHSGVWDAFSGRTDNGQEFCGIGTTNPSDGRGFSIRFAVGSDAVDFSVVKPGWSIPAGTKVTVVMQVGVNSPWTEQAMGDEHRVKWTMDQTAVQLFDTQFRREPNLTLTFPDGNEPTWTLSLQGSTAIDNTFGRCITDLSRREQQGVPANTPAATQPFGKAAIPVAKAPSVPPQAAAPAPPNGTPPPPAAAAVPVAGTPAPTSQPAAPR